MGAIVANEIVRSFGGLPFPRIVYMAAACSIRDFIESVAQFMLRNPNESTFHNLCLDPEAEVRELNVRSLSPRGSLLQWIDQFFQEPDATPERVLGKWVSIV